VGDRVKTIGLDALTDDFPNLGCDAVLFAHFLEIWSPDKVKLMLRKASRVLTKDASIFLISKLQNDDELGPMLVALLASYFATVASGEGQFFTKAELSALLRDAGFEILNVYPVAADDLIEGVRVSDPLS
jgi:hypothetical protein